MCVLCGVLENYNKGDGKILVCFSHTNGRNQVLYKDIIDATPSFLKLSCLGDYLANPLVPFKSTPKAVVFNRVTTTQNPSK